MTVTNTIIRILCFRLSHEEILRFNKKHFIAGLTGTWLVGIGRYWDDAGATILQHAGLGSVIYIFSLSLFIWLIVKPFKVNGWSYFRTLTFISLTSFPAILYAIPVERFLSIGTANVMNVWFLAIVAVWRLCLLYRFLKIFTRLSYGNILVITFMPICLIISVLTALNLHRVVFNIMGGIRNPTPHDSSYFVLMFLTVVSVILSLPLLIGYIVGVVSSRDKNKKQ
jgi:hypothetical protein